MQPRTSPDAPPVFYYEGMSYGLDTSTLSCNPFVLLTTPHAHPNHPPTTPQMASRLSKWIGRVKSIK